MRNSAIKANWILFKGSHGVPPVLTNQHLILSTPTSAQAHRQYLPLGPRVERVLLAVLCLSTQYGNPFLTTVVW